MMPSFQRRILSVVLGALAAIWGISGAAGAGRSPGVQVAPRPALAPCAAAASEPARTGGGFAAWQACDGRLRARFYYGPSRVRGPVYLQTSASIGMPASLASSGGLPGLAGTVPLAYFELASFSTAAALTYAAPAGDQSLIASPAIARGASYELVGYERVPLGPNAPFRVVYQSAVYAASSPGILPVKSPLAGLTVLRATPVYFALLSVSPFDAVSAAAVVPSRLRTSTACRGEIGTPFDPNPGTFASTGAAQSPGLPCFADFSAYAALPARTGGTYTLTFATSTDKTLGSIPSTSCGSSAAPCGTPIFYASIKPNVAVRFAGTTPSLAIAVNSPSAISLTNQYAAALYDLGSKRTIQSLAFIVSRAGAADRISFDVPFASLSATGVVVIVYRQPLLPTLALSKTDNGGSAGWTIAQMGAAYTLTVSNAGKRATSDTIDVSDALPHGLTLSAAPSGKGWVCSGTTGGVALSCTSTTAIAPSASGAAISVPVNVGSTAPLGTKSIANTALASGGGDPLHATSAHAARASDSTTISGIPVLALSKTDNGGTAGWTIGRRGAAYTLTVSNTGTRATSGTIAVSDALPNGLTLGATPSGTGWACTGSTGSTSFSCTTTTVIAPSAGGAAISVPVNVGTTTPLGTKSVANTALASGGGDPLHATSAHAARASDSTTISGIPVLALSKTDNGGTAGWTIGQSGAAYTLTVSNTGTAATSGTITESDALPNGLTLSATPSGTGWACTGSTGSTSFSCTTTTVIAATASGAPISVPVNVGSTAPLGTKSIANTALASGGGDPLHATSAHAARASDSTTISGIPVLALSKTDNGGTAGWTIGQSGAAYTLTVSNTGTAATSGTITVSDTPPPGIYPTGAFSGAGWACSVGKLVLTCSWTTPLAPGASSVALTVPVNVGTNAPIGTKSITNTASSYGGGDPVHTSASPATASDSTTITGIPALSLTKTDDGGTAGWTIGQSGATYTLTVSNAGTVATSGTITVSDTLPQGLTLSATPSGNGWVCSGTTGGVALSCTSTTAIAPSASGAAISVPVNVGTTAPVGTKSVANTASAFGGGDPLHTTLANAVNASDSTTVTGVPVLALSKTDNSGAAGWLPKQVGSAYTLTVTNTGTGATTGAITVSDSLPSGLTLSSNPLQSGWVCAGSAGNTSFSCTLSTALAPGASGPAITVPVYVGGNTPEGANAISNTATAYGGGDPVHTSTNPARSNVDATTIVYTAPNIFVADRSGGVDELLAAGGYSTPSQLGSGFNGPAGVAVDGFGNVYVADTGNNAIKLIDDGVFTFGSGFNGPEGVAVDTAGNIYVSDSNNNAVKEIPVGNGTPITLGSGFNFPIGLAVDGAGNVYVADSGNFALKEIPAGNGAPITLVSGVPGSSLLCGTFVPVGVAVDQAGNLFVANLGPDGPYTVDYLPKGKGTCVAIGPQPNSFGPGGIAVDAADNVYVTSDGGSVGVYEILAAGGYTTIKQLYTGFGNPTGIAVAPAAPSSQPRRAPSRGDAPRR